MLVFVDLSLSLFFVFVVGEGFCSVVSGFKRLVDTVMPSLDFADSSAELILASFLSALFLLVVAATVLVE